MIFNGIRVTNMFKDSPDISQPINVQQRFFLVWNLILSVHINSSPDYVLNEQKPLSSAFGC